jgi:hypothetical protein
MILFFGLMIIAIVSIWGAVSYAIFRYNLYKLIKEYED